jgi:hypothetical protein
MVTTNLEVALRYLRHQKAHKVLWVDALCINQEDIKERNYQVRTMRDIYVAAEKVVVWLGEEGDAKVALDPCDTINENKEKQIYPDYSDTEFEACYKLFYGRPWWRRTWILR